MLFLKKKILLPGYPFLAVLLVVGLTRLILLPFESVLQIQVIALLYLLPVIVSTVLWGLIPGILAGFSAFLVFNYYYIIPPHTFQVRHTQDLITLIVFLIISVVISQLIGQAREGARLARSREWEATRMYELISALAGLQDSQSVIHALAQHTIETFRFERVEVSNEDPVQIARAGAFAGRPEVDSQVTRMPLVTARGREGEMRLWFGRVELSDQENRLLNAYLSQGALALERIRLVKSENKARVLEETNQLKTALLNSVSHELRSPLAAIKASVSSLRSGSVDWNTAARQDLLATVEEEADHLNLLVGNLLDMSRIESGALNPQKRWNAIEEIAMGVVTRMRKTLGDHLLEMDFPEDLPLIPTDYIMIEQVFTNLISNSVKYAPSGTVISISSKTEGDYVHTQVANQGPPVPQAHLERIFDKFYRVTEADRVTGTGLGLSICKGIIEVHGGKIWAENQENHFTFHFLLPRTLDGALPYMLKEAGDG